LFAKYRINGPLIIALLLAAVFALAVVWNGVPSLRQDWIWPRERGDFVGNFVLAISGWTPIGLGSPNPYPVAYLIAAPLVLARLLLGPTGSLLLYAFGIGALCTLSTNALLRSYSALSPLSSVGLGAFVLFNPWTYTQLVAGHLGLLVAFGALLGIVAQLKRQGCNPLALSFLVVIIFIQVQFFVLILPLLLYAALWRRQWLPLLTAIVIALPIIVGIVGNLHALLGIPFTLAWQQTQSVDPSGAPLMLGYFLPYAGQYHDVYQLPLNLVLIVVALGMFRAQDDRFAQTGLLLTAFALIIAMGTRGPLGSAYADVVKHLPFAGLYRELYDLIACVVIGYAVLLTCAVRGYRFGAAAVFAAGVLCAAVWLGAPPARWWISQSAIPPIRIQLPKNTRYALLPAFQPVSLGNSGSGADPDTVYYGNDVAPLNEYLSTYPVNAAFAHYLADGDARQLTALGVAGIYPRPWLHTDSDSLSHQSAEPLNLPQVQTRNVSVLRQSTAMPFVTITGLPAIGTLNTDLSANAAFFGDVAQLGGAFVPRQWMAYQSPAPIVVSNAQIRADRAWVDARLDFIAHPELAQAFGGAVTTSPHVLLPIAGGTMILAYVQGALTDQSGRTVLRAKGAYRWITLSNSVRALACRGRCVLALRGIAPDAPQNPAPQASRQVPFRVVAPWLLWVRADTTGVSTLRLNAAYDPNWIAIADGRPLPHFRLDAIVNAWIVPPQTHSSVLLLNVVAALQTLFEILGYAWVLWLLWMAMASKRWRRTLRRSS